jgi:hypothetical protein
LEELLGSPDFISSDAQGAELDILTGLDNLIDNVQGIVTEAEVIEIYSKADLFHNQIAFLLKKQFFLIDIFSKQNWYKKVKYGKGIFAVGEALFIKDIDKSNQDFEKLLKNGLICYSFERFDLAFAAFESIKQDFNDDYTNLIEHRNFSWIQTFSNSMRLIQNKLNQDPFSGWRFEVANFKRGPMSHEWGQWVTTPFPEQRVRKSNREDWFKDNPFLEDRYKDLEINSKKVNIHKSNTENQRMRGFQNLIKILKM